MDAYSVTKSWDVRDKRKMGVITIMCTHGSKCCIFVDGPACWIGKILQEQRKMCFFIVIIFIITGLMTGQISNGGSTSFGVCDATFSTLVSKMPTAES